MEVAMNRYRRWLVQLPYDVCVLTGDYRGRIWAVQPALGMVSREWGTKLVTETANLNAVLGNPRYDSDGSRGRSKAFALTAHECETNRSARTTGSIWGNRRCTFLQSWCDNIEKRSRYPAVSSRFLLSHKREGVYVSCHANLI